MLRCEAMANFIPVEGQVDTRAIKIDLYTHQRVYNQEASIGRFES